MNETVWQFEHSVVCNASKSFVWRFWTDVSNWERLEGKAVEWIKLKGAFIEGASGVTKMPGQDPRYWEVKQVEPECSATIEMPLDDAVFYNRMVLKSLSPDRTLITQSMSLAGARAIDLAAGMHAFEINAPQGLAKLAKAIELSYKVI